MQAQTALSDIAEDATLLADAARDAGEIALRFFRRDPRSWLKEGDHPVSEADLAVDLYLAEHLRARRPDYGWLSEETADTPDRLSRRRLFVVDPIDGTRAFIAGAEDWTISVAVVEEGRPVAAALYAPISDRLFTAHEGGGTLLNHRPLDLRAGRPRASLRVAGPRRLARQLPGHGLDPGAAVYISSLALRIALVAAGRFEVALATGGAHDWDIAAAHLILGEAGGRLTGFDGAALRYNTPDALQPALVGAAEPLHGSLIEAIGAGPA